MHNADALERRASGNEQCLEIVAAEADLCGSLGDLDPFQLFAVGIVDMHLAPGRCVQVAFDVDGHLVAASFDVEQSSSFLQMSRAERSATRE